MFFKTLSYDLGVGHICVIFTHRCVVSKQT
jgi:hypothetical protein